MKHETKPERAHPNGPEHSRDSQGERGMKHHGRGGRPKRLFDYGELRLLILAMIAARPRHGYEIIKEIGDRFEGDYIPSPGVVYPTLSWLEDMGYIVIDPDENGRKLSRMSPEGEAFLVVNRQAADELLIREMPQGRRPGIPAEIEAAMDTLKAAMRKRMEKSTSDETDIAVISAAILAAAQSITEIQ